jgi:3D (Asp-Asp-Asp) domain-containing protein
MPRSPAPSRSRLAADTRRRPPAEPWTVRLLTAVGLAVLTAVLVFAGCATATIRPDKKHYHAPKAVPMSVTGYCNCGACCSWHHNWYGRPTYSSGPNKGRRKTLGLTASGTRARTGTVAADPRRYPMGTIVYVPGYGYGRVEDTGGAIKGDALDLWFSSHRRAQHWGRQKLTVHVWLPK